MIIASILSINHAENNFNKLRCVYSEQQECQDDIGMRQTRLILRDEQQLNLLKSEDTMNINFPFRSDSATSACRQNMKAQSLYRKKKIFTVSIVREKRHLMSVFQTYRKLHVVQIFKNQSGIFPCEKMGMNFPKTPGQKNQNPAGKSLQAVLPA